MSDDAAATAAFALCLTVLLGGIGWIDARRMVIPDALNAALAALGAACQLRLSPEPRAFHAAVGVATASAFWAVRRAHFGATGRVGLGLGDVKMAGACGVWLDPAALPLFLFTASAGALLFVAGRAAVAGPAARLARHPFGPFLAFGLLVAWLSGTDLFTALRNLP